LSPTRPTVSVVTRAQVEIEGYRCVVDLGSLEEWVAVIRFTKEIQDEVFRLSQISFFFSRSIPESLFSNAGADLFKPSGGEKKESVE
jgi:hypothetical protein